MDFVPLGLNCSQQWKEEASLINESHSSSCDVSHLCLFSHPCPHPARLARGAEEPPGPVGKGWSLEEDDPIASAKGKGQERAASAGQSPFAYVLSYLPVH